MFVLRVFYTNHPEQIVLKPDGASESVREFFISLIGSHLLGHLRIGGKGIWLWSSLEPACFLRAPGRSTNPTQKEKRKKKKNRLNEISQGQYIDREEGWRQIFEKYQT